MIVIAVSLCGGCQRERASDGAEDEEPEPAPKTRPFPGHDPPAIEELVREAEAKGPPRGEATEYERPEEIEVKPPPEQDLGWLPKDDQGRPIAYAERGVNLVIDETLHDPITAKGSCVSMVSECVASPERSDTRTLDACWAWTPECVSNQPWNGEGACCHPACGDLYAELRTRGYPDIEASVLTMESDCFPSLPQFLRRHK